MTEDSSNSLLINDLFWTFQGEGKFAGTRALFVRMPYCNLACAWCDTQFNSFKKWSEEEFSVFAASEKSRFAVITGGEPSMNKQTPRVIAALKKLGFYIAMETNGNFPIPEGVNFVTCSPKRDASPPYYVHADVWPRVSEFKYVVDRDFDFSILDRHDIRDKRRYSLSPEFGELTYNLNRIFEFIKENPRWRISLQTHKWMAIP